MEYDEHSVASGFLAGDPEAHKLIQGWIMRVLGTPRFRGLRHEWPDLQQEVLRGVLESLRGGRFNPERDLRAYIQSIAHYIGHAALLRRIRSSRLASEAPAAAVTPTAAAAAAEDLRLEAQQVREVMRRIPDPWRELLTMFYYEQRSYAEIASTLNVPMGTVKSRLFRAVRKAAVALAEEQSPSGSHRLRQRLGAEER